MLQLQHLLYLLLLVTLLGGGGQAQLLVPGLRWRQVPVLNNGQIQVTQYLDSAVTVTPQLVQEDFRNKSLTLVPLLKDIPKPKNLDEWT